MNIKANVKIGVATYQFEVEEKDEMDTLHKIFVLTNPPMKCDECNNEDKEKFTMDSNKDTQGNTYVNIICSKCTARAKLGQYKTGGFFWRKFEIYRRTNGNNK